MTKPLEIYQIQPIRELTKEDINSLVNELNRILFNISSRLTDFDTPQDLSSATTVANLVDALVAAKIGTE